MLLCSIGLWAQELKLVDGIYYNFDHSTLTASVTNIGYGQDFPASDSYSGSITIPSTVVFDGTSYIVTSIGYSNFGHGAFESNGGLTSVTIPNSVTSIGERAFSGCTGLNKAEFASVESLCNMSFGNYESNPLCYAHHLYINGKEVTDLAIPNSVTSIGSSAFSGCSGLTSVTIPNSVTSIGEDAFYGCTGLTSITIPNSVTSIGSSAFYKVKHVIYTGSATGSPWGAIAVNGFVDGDFVFSDNTKTTLLAYIGNGGDVTIPSGVTSIGSSAFYDCDGLTSVTIPNSVTSIGSSAFSGCSGLTSITIPNSVTSIGYEAFEGCTGLTSITIPNSVTSIGSSAFDGCTGLTSITIPNSVTSIGYEAFEGCTGLTSIEIPNSVTSIGGSAFGGCTGLTSIIIPNSVTSIGWSAFSGCSNIENADINSQSALDAISFTNKLTSIKLGDKITSIASSKFSGCSGLTSVTIPSSVTSIGSSAFNGCTGLKEVINKSDLNITKGSTANGYVAYYADYVCNGGKTVIGDFIFSDQDKTLVKYTGNGGNITLPENFNGGSYTIGASVFSGNTTLTSITIPNSVTSIGEHAFDGCTGLTSVTIPNSVTSIGTTAFHDCSALTNADINSQSALDVISFTNKLTSIKLGDKITSIGNYKFQNCANLTSVTIPNSVTNIGASAFSGCSGLTSVTIPSSVTNIGASAFSGCSGLTSVTIPSSVTNIGAGTFSGCSGLTSVTIPNSATSIGTSAFSGCSGLTSVTIPSSVTNIGAGTFYGCNGLTSVIIGDGVTSIGYDAFYNCTGLTSVTIPNSVTSIESQAFYGCSGLTEIICEGETPAGSNTIFGEGGEAGKIYVKALLKVPSQWFKLYKVTEPWCRFDMTASDFDMVVIPYENKAVFTWTPITGAEAYELTVIEKETGEALCSLNFDAYGRLRGLVLRNDSEKTYVGGYDFTVTSLRGDVEYDYTMEVKDISDNVIESMSGTFRTSDGVATATPEAEESIVETARYDINGRPLTAPTKGVNIVKYSDGSFEKEFVR